MDNSIFDELTPVFNGDVQTDCLTRHLYSTDASSYKVLPTAIVMPKTVEDVQAVMRFAAKHSIPLTARGAGTSLSGQAIGPGIVMDYSRHFDHILEINAEEHWARVEPGVVLDHLSAAAAPYGLMYAVDPSSAGVSTFGGALANNAAGSHSVLFGLAVDHILSMDVVLSDGSLVSFEPKTEAEVAALAQESTLEASLYREIPALLERYREPITNNYPKIWRSVSGYTLDRLLAAKNAGEPLNLAVLPVGSEGTLCQIVSAKVKLADRPKFTRLLVIHYPSLESSLRSVPLILSHKPAAIELMNHAVITLVREHPGYSKIQDHYIVGDPGAVLFTEFYGSSMEELDAKAAALIEHLRQEGYSDPIVQRVTPTEISEVWNVRKSSLGLMQSMRSESKPISFMDDVAVPIDELVEYVKDMEEAFAKEGTYATFTAHASAGCLHVAPALNLKLDEDIQKMARFSEAIVDIAIKHHGTTSGEHGEGRAKSMYNENLFGKELHQAFVDVKKLFDPENILNPDIIVSGPEPWDPKILRYYPGYDTPYTIKDTSYDFSMDNGFAGAVEMCNGAAYCRRMEPGIMCPTFRVLQDEGHSTRGRSNVLRLAMVGEFGEEGLLSPEVKELLDLCLMCKGCKKECPSAVDMTKLKSEYLAYTYSKNGVPLRARMFGSIGTLLELGSLVPGVSNFMFENGLFKRALEFIGIERSRSLPAIAKQSFQSWFKNHKRTAPITHGKVIFWDDCFTSFNSPEIGAAAVKILEHAGFEVMLIAGTQCCGRTNFSKGLIKDAERQARHNLALLLPYVKQGIDIVGVEPSCITSFRDEYLDLRLGEDAKLLAKHCFHFEEFLTRLVDAEPMALKFLPSNGATTIHLHGQCYQKSTIGTEYTHRMLELMPNTKVTEIPSSCCGMAGSFGYEKEHYELSMQLGEKSLFPAIRELPADAVLAAAGTSCRSQIKQGTKRIAKHPVEILAEHLAD